MASLWKRGQGNRLKASNDEVTVSFFSLNDMIFCDNFSGQDGSNLFCIWVHQCIQKEQWDNLLQIPTHQKSSYKGEMDSCHFKKQSISGSLDMYKLCDKWENICTVNNDMLFLVPNRQNVHQLSICHNACFQSGSFPLPSLSQTQGSGGRKNSWFLAISPWSPL